MTEKKKRTPSALLVIGEMYETAKANCMKHHNRINLYGKPDQDYNKSQEKVDLDAKKEKVIEILSKEIEQYAIKAFSKYGLIVVPLCHRSSVESGEDRLKIDLKVKKFPGCEKEVKAFEEECTRYKEDMAAIEKWHMDALQAIATKEELPNLPEFVKAK